MSITFNTTWTNYLKDNSYEPSSYWFASLNVNSFRMLAQFQKVWPEYSTMHRAMGVWEWYQTMNLFMCVFFELDDEFCDKLSEFAVDAGLFIHVQSYNNSKGAFKFLVVTKSFMEVSAFALTKDETYYSDENRPVAPAQGEQPTSEFLSYKENIFGDNFEKTLIKIDFFGLHVYVTHLGLANSTKILQSEKVAEIITRESGDNMWLLTGDFNCFDATKSVPTILMDQINKFRDIGEWRTESVMSTFRAFLYDIFFKLSQEQRTMYNVLKDKFIEESSAENIEIFRLFCEDMAKEYGCEGSALDHVFTHKYLELNVEVQDMGNLSDHFAIVVSF
jgi:hypothetical protein